MKTLKYYLIASLFAAPVFANPVLRIESGTRAQNLVPAWVWSCYPVAAKKIKSQADLNRVKVIPGTLRIVDVDTNLMAKYIWWRAETLDETSKETGYVQKLTQTPALGKCF